MPISRSRVRGIVKERHFEKRRLVTSGHVLLEYIFMDRERERTVVYVNGWALRHSEWKLQMHQHPSCNQLFFNSRGTGNTGMGDSDQNTYLFDCARDLADLIRGLELKKVTLVGHSMGTLLALEAINTHFPNSIVDSLVMVSPCVCNPIRTFPQAGLLKPLLAPIELAVRAGRLHGVTNWALRRLTNDATLAPLYMYFRQATKSAVNFETFKKYIESIVQIDAEAFITAFKAMVGYGDLIGSHMKRIDIPALAITGEHDPLVSPESFGIIRAAMGGVTFSVFRRATHFPQAERPNFFNFTVGGFVSAVEAEAQNG